METNNLIYKTSKTVKYRDTYGTIYVTIELNDECKNGHQDFSITGSIFAGRQISGGCIHESILKHFPEFELFIKLHLSDAKGVPMYAVENGYYHLKNGFNRTPVSSPEFQKEFCEYYRITVEQFEKLKTSKNKIQYAIMLKELNILDQWEKEANEAIKMLEGLTGNTFINDSIKSNFHYPTNEEIEEELKKQKEGYYTEEAEKQRQKEEINSILNKMEEEKDKEINTIQLEFEVKKSVLLNAGKRFLDNCIFYKHSNTLTFNWRNYNKISKEEIEKIIPLLNLPEYIKIDIK